MANTKAHPELRKISIATVRSRQDATAIVRKLTEAGIESYLVEERSFATRLSARRQLGAVKVQVESRDIKRALQCLQAKESPQSAAAADERAVSQPVSSSPNHEAARLVLPLGVGLALLVALALLLLL